MVNTYSTPYRGRALLFVAIGCLALAFVLTTIVVEPLLKLKAMSFTEAADFQGFDGTLCGHVARVSPDEINGGTVLFFDNSYTPSFVVLISSRKKRLYSSYDNKDVCVAGRFLKQGEGPQRVPSIRLNDDSQIAIK